MRRRGDRLQRQRAGQRTDRELLGPGGCKAVRTCSLPSIARLGDLLWLRQFGTSEVDDPNGQLTVDADDNALMSGGTSGSFDGQTGPGAWVAKFDASGSSSGCARLPATPPPAPRGVATDADGNVVVGGTTGDGIAVGGPNQGYTDAWVAKYSSAGDLLWMRQFGSSEYDFELCIATGREGDILIAGETSGSLGGSIQGETDAWVGKLTPNGDVLWVDQLGTEMTDKATNVAAGRPATSSSPGLPTARSAACSKGMAMPGS